MSEARRIDRPEPLYQLMRCVKNGPMVPACIRWEQTKFEPGNVLNAMDRSPVLTARIAGELVEIADVWECRGQPITAEEYEFRVKDAAWAREHAPAEPIANPRKPIDLRTMPMPF